MRHQGRNILAALPQWWQQDGEDVQTIVEVATKFASIHHVVQITVSGSNEPHVNFVSPTAAQALEFLFLQDTQQFGLQCRWNVAHLVEEKRTFIGQLETANLLRDGSGERALLVAKKLAFQQIQWNGGAVQPHERTSAPRTNVVNRVRDELLAGARFSLDQHSRTGGRDPFDLFEHGFQSRAVADDLLESARVRILITTPQYFGSCHREPPRTACTLLIGLNSPVGLNSPELPEHSRAEPHRRMVLPRTPLRLLSRPASAFSR